MEAANRPYFKNLDIWRFFAASFVVLGHCFRADSIQALNLPFPVNHLIFFLLDGKNWVSLFFVLSGFLIGYLGIYDKLNRKYSIKNFFIRRILRIWPLYFIFIVIGYIFIPFLAQILFDKNYTYHNAWKFIVFIGNFSMMEMYRLSDFTLIPHSVSILWSISIEEQFYLLVSILILLIPIKKLPFSFAMTALIGLCFILSSASQDAGNQYHTLYYMFDFFIGALAGYGIATQLKFYRFIRFRSKFLALTLVLLFILLLLFYSYLNTKIYLSLFYVLLILYFALADSRLNRLLEKQKFLHLGGKISYGIYVIHPILQYSFYKLANVYLSNLSNIISDSLVFIFTFCSTFILAYFSYRFIESYFLKLKTKFY